MSGGQIVQLKNRNSDRVVAVEGGSVNASAAEGADNGRNSENKNHDILFSQIANKHCLIAGTFKVGHVESNIFTFEQEGNFLALSGGSICTASAVCIFFKITTLGSLRNIELFGKG